MTDILNLIDEVTTLMSEQLRQQMNTDAPHFDLRSSTLSH
jgi:hypothetical protein